MSADEYKLLMKWLKRGQEARSRDFDKEKSKPVRDEAMMNYYIGMSYGYSLAVEAVTRHQTRQRKKGAT